MAADNEITLLTRGSTLSNTTLKTWLQHPEEEGQQPHVKFLPPEGGVPSPQRRCSESESSSVHEAATETRPSAAAQERLNLSLDTSRVSVRSTDTTLEYYDAPLSEDQEGSEQPAATEKDEDILTLNINAMTETEEPEEMSSMSPEQSSGLVSENREEEGEVDGAFKDVETADEPEAEHEEENQSIKEDEKDVDSSSTQDAAVVEQPSHSQGKASYISRSTRTFFNALT